MLLVTTACTTSSYSWREVPDPYLRDIAIIRIDRDQSYAVVYNPEACQQIGDACLFFRSHAYAHQRLNHLIIDVPSSYPDLWEKQADCWAARYTSQEVALAAVEFFENPEHVTRWRVPGDPAERARTIRECAGLGT